MCSFSKSQIKLMNVGKKLFHSPSSNAELLNILVHMEQLLSEVKDSPSESMLESLRPIIEALIAKEIVRHPNMDVNISVANCICEITRIMAPKNPYNSEQMKDFFELVVTTFENLYRASGGCYTKMTRVLKLLSKYRLSVQMLGLELDGYRLIVRLFKLFLSVADSNSSLIVHEMEKIMTMIILESEVLALGLRGFVATFIEQENQPVCKQLAEKVLMNCEVQQKPKLQKMSRDMSIALYDYAKLVACVRKSALENDIMIKDEKNDDPPTPSEEVTDVKGKRKRNDIPKTKKVGENLVGSRIKVWWPDDKMYYQGVVKSFDCNVKKHKVLYDDDEEEILDLKEEKWELVENSPTVADFVLEHGENLVRRRIKVWWPLYGAYYAGVVESFDPIKRKHKVLYDDGDEELICLKGRRWEFVKDSSHVSYPAKKLVLALPKRLSRPSGIVRCQRYEVKKNNKPILEDIFKKHGDIAAECVLADLMRSSIVDNICDIYRQIQTKDVTNITSMIQKIESQVSYAEKANINVAWLRVHLADIKKKLDMKTPSLLPQKRASTILVKEAAKMDLKERPRKLVMHSTTA
ncbi:uncharacterized protein [Rutidosis leptorrhynchoides]|uniref:uncharacterized protein isoform X2 n=1 Tax=Rutidosis leptorrhynchoides TaxID=125765 RepID=UPI003A99B3BA